MNKLVSIIVISLTLFSCNKDSLTIPLISIPPIEYTDRPEGYLNVNQPCLELERNYDFDLSQYQINPDLDLYELCSSNIDKFDKYETDENGIYLTELNGNSVYYPITITQGAVTFYKHYKSTNDAKSLAQFLVLSDWLKDNFTDFGDYGYWFCNGYNSGYDLTGPWPSAMGQGFGLMVMYQAFLVTKDEKYLDICNKALNGFDHDVSENGITNKTHELMWQFEEYPTDVPSEVLNGEIFALCGLNDYYEATGSEKAFELYTKGLRYLEQNICRYSLFFSSRYNLYSAHPALANATNSGTGDGYHHLHIQQLLWLYTKTSNHIFLEYATNFLEKDLGEYEQNIVPKKIENVDASYSIVASDYGPDNLNDGVWSYGYYWSTNKDTTELYVDFNNQKNDINRLSFFFTNESSTQIDVDIYYKIDDNSNWEFSQSISNSDSLSSFSDFYNTRHFNTYIHTYMLKSLDAKQIKLRIIKGESVDIVAFREIDFQYDRSDDIEVILAGLVQSLGK
jgi:heparosan-N-sulfate-glucuronate 5-epimerase